MAKSPVGVEKTWYSRAPMMPRISTQVSRFQTCSGFSPRRRASCVASQAARTAPNTMRIPYQCDLEGTELKQDRIHYVNYLRNRLYVRTASTKPVKIVYFQLCSITPK